MFKQILYIFHILKKLHLNFSKLVIFISVSFCFYLFIFFTSYFVVFLSYQTNILWLTSSWKQKLCVLEKGSDFSNVDYLILGSPTRFVIFCFFPSLQRVVFHPNCNYIATGSCDRTVRLWDINTGSSVRFFTGHKVCVRDWVVLPLFSFWVILFW